MLSSSTPKIKSHPSGKGKMKKKSSSGRNAEKTRSLNMRRYQQLQPLQKKQNQQLLVGKYTDPTLGSGAGSRVARQHEDQQRWGSTVGKRRTGGRRRDLGLGAPVVEERSWHNPFDAVIYFGDLNYRTDLPRLEVIRLNMMMHTDTSRYYGTRFCDNK